MRYLKTFENYTAQNVENLKYFEKVSKSLEDSEISPMFEELVKILRRSDTSLIEKLFEDIEGSSQLLYEEAISTYRMESNKIDTQKMAREALKYLVTVGAISVLVKLFYKIGDYVFSNLDEMGIPSIAGGVILILLYLAFGRSSDKTFTNKDKNKTTQKSHNSDNDYLDFEEM